MTAHIDSTASNMLIQPHLFHRAFGNPYSAGGKDSHLTKNQQKALFILKSNGKMTHCQLGKSLDMKRGSLTTLIDNLVEEGLVVRLPDEEDRRKIWILLSDRGRTHVNKMFKLVKEELISCLDILDDKDIRTLHRALEDVNAVYSKLYQIQSNIK